MFAELYSTKKKRLKRFASFFTRAYTLYFRFEIFAAPRDEKNKKSIFPVERETKLRGYNKLIPLYTDRKKTTLQSHTREINYVSIFTE